MLDQQRSFFPNLGVKKLRGHHLQQSSNLSANSSVPVSERRIHQFFKISVFVKGFYAVLECSAGLGLALINPSTIINWITWLTQDEFAHDPHDYITILLLKFAESFSITSNNFYMFYLLGHGLVKLLLVVGL